MLIKAPQQVIEMNTAMINENFKKLFDELEQRHLEIRTRVNSFSETGNDLEEKLAEEINDYEPWRLDIMDRLGEITTDFDRRSIRVHKKYIQGTEYFGVVQEAPFYWRIINKPNGYAGDAEMMNYIYRNQFEGTTPFGMFLHKHAVTTKACQSVRNRKDYLYKQILQTQGGQILSLAAGPAQEIKDVLLDNGSNHYRFLALDHDLDTLRRHDINSGSDEFTYALANAYQIISEKYQAAKPKQFMMRYCYPRKDFRGFRKIFNSLKYHLIDLKENRFDLIYSAGLYDYIRSIPLDDSKGTVALTKNLFNLLNPGGSLVIGNFNHSNPRDLKFVMEYIYDWKLIYRNKYDMYDFVRTINKNEIKDIQIIEEPLGINYFLKVDKE